MYRSVHRFVAGLFVAVVAHGSAAAPIHPVLPCDRQVLVFGGSTILAEGVRVPGSNDFASRIRRFFDRVCGGSTLKFETVAGDGSNLIGEATRISARLAKNPKSIALIHFPATDIEKDASVDQLLRAYREIFDVCARSGSVCIIGGQQPVNAFGQEASDRQLELERRAAAAFGRNFLPLYRYFQSESGTRRLMVPLDSGDGRFVDDRGHELLFRIYRGRLLELIGSTPSSKQNGTR